MSYADAGVDIDAGNALVEAIKPLVRATRRPGADAEIGGFGGLFDLKAAGYSDPVLVAATDGVGTKLKIAIETGILDTVGIDLVAMCVNDLVVQGAEPLFFLDYFATGKLDPEARRANRRRHRRGLPPGRRRADRRRDRRNARHVCRQGLRSGRLRRRRRRARRRPATQRHRAPATWSWRSPRPASIPTASRWCASWSPMPGSPSTAPAPFDNRAQPRRGAADADAHLCEAAAGGHAGDRRGQGDGPHHRRRHHREPAARAAREPRRAASTSARLPVPPVFRWLAALGEHRPGARCCAPSIAASACCWSSPAASVAAVTSALAAAGETVVAVGEVADAHGRRRSSIRGTLDLESS